MIRNITLLLLLISPNLAVAATKYVGPSGTGTTCSYASPCSVTYAMANANTTDNLWIFKDGTYNVGQQGEDYRTPTLNPSNSGTVGSPITFQAENKLGAIINGTVKDGTINCVLLGSKSKDYIVWDGFKTTCSGGSYMSMVVISGVDGGGDHCTLKNLDVVGASHSTGGSNNYEGILLDSASNALVQNNYVHGFIETSDNHNTSGYKSYITLNSIVENNTFSNNTCNIYPKFGGTGDTFRNNLLLAPGGTENVYIENFAQAHVNQVWHNNIIIGGGAINFQSQGSNGNSISVYNNTFYNTRSLGIGGQDTNTWASWNNIVSGNASFEVIGWSYLNPNYLNYNQYYLSSGSPSFVARAYSTPCTASSLATWQGSCEYDAASISTNPNFINPGGTTAADYKRSSYPTNGRGSGYESVMGAYITGNEIIGYSTSGGDTTAPVRSEGSPSGALSSGTTSIAMSLTTDEAATCKYGSTAGVAYASIANTFSTTGGTSHSVTISGLSDGGSYSRYIRCSDSIPNVNTDDYTISWTVNNTSVSATVLTGSTTGTIR